MPADLSGIPPLLGGFWFVLRTQLLYLISLQFGQGFTILLSALVGFLATMITRLAILGIVSAGWQEPMQLAARHLWPVPFSGTSLGAFAIAILLAEGSKLLMRTQRVNRWVINHFAAENVKLLYASMLEIRPVSLTLDTRKVYVGFVQAIPSLDPAKAFVRLMPILSGCRRQDDLTLEFTTEYSDALRDASSAGDFIIVLPLASVKSVNLFDVQTYRRHFGKPGSDPKRLINS